MWGRFIGALAVRLRGGLVAAALREAIDGIVRRHEVLRTTFTAPGGEPVQVLHPAAPVTMAVTDLGHLSLHGLCGGCAEREASGRSVR